MTDVSIYIPSLQGTRSISNIYDSQGLFKMLSNGKTMVVSMEEGGRRHPVFTTEKECREVCEWLKACKNKTPLPADSPKVAPSSRPKTPTRSRTPSRSKTPTRSRTPQTPRPKSRKMKAQRAG